MNTESEPVSLPWFERWPELLDWELDRFRARQLAAKIDDKPPSKGMLLIHSQASYRGEQIDLRVAYPAEYPELPPVIYGPAGLLDRHQHHFQGNFCLLENEFDSWPAGSWGAADLIAERLDALLADTTTGPEKVRAAEVPVPEPVTAYYTYARGAAVLLPGDIASPDGQSGALALRQVTPHTFLVTAIGSRQSESPLVSLFPDNSEQLKGRWQQLDARPETSDGTPRAVIEWIRENHPDILAREVPPVLRGKRRVPQPPPIEIAALTFPEEGPGVGETRPAWLFVCVDRRNEVRNELLVHSQLVSTDERERRLADIVGLGGRRVLVVGAGSLGGDVAIELARAGVGQLDVVDHDRYEANNTVRHPLGTEYAGLQKATAVALACRHANPFCTPKAHEMRLGEMAWGKEGSPADRLRVLVDAADLVVDATGSHQLAQFVARLAGEAGVPFVSCWLTSSSYGAEIVRVVPGRTCCWNCFVAAQRDGRILQAEAGPDGPVTVQGCGQPTTIGTGFDATEAAASTTRLVVQMLLGDDGDYGDCSWDHATLNFRRRPDDAEFPRFAVESLSPTSESTECQHSAGLTAMR